MDDTTDREHPVTITFSQGYTFSCRMTDATLEQNAFDTTQSKMAGAYDVRQSTLDAPAKVVLALGSITHIG